MTLDSYVTLGRSGLRISPFTLGTMTFGEDHGWGSSPEESKSILAAYLDRGGNSIDTANIYTNGHSETIIGDYFAGQHAQRDRVVIGTKFFGNLYENDPNGGGPSRKAIMQQLENSLRRMRTDYVDIYWLHNFDRPRRPTRPSGPWMTWSPLAKSAMSDSPTSRRGRQPRQPPSHASADGLRSSHCSSSTPSSSGPRKASSSRWHRPWAWACCRGAR
nr:aldo/keto reductase [Rhodococcus sp. JVH1]